MAKPFSRPDPLIFDGSIAKNWQKFEQEYDILVAAAHGDKPDKPEVYVLLDPTGAEAMERQRSFTYALLIPAVI